VTTASELIRNLRKSHGLTLRALADKAGTSSATLSNYELGVKEPRLSTLERLVKAVGSELHCEVVHAFENGEWNDARLSATEASRQVAAAIKKQNDEVAFRTCLELIDDLKAVTPIRLAQLTRDSPPLTGNSHYDALLAAIVEDACVNTGAPTPAWVYETTRSVEKWYLSGIDSLHDDAERDTPPIFRRHGVLIIEEELSRA
jgi:transcriptional regulator with XRE-family HTH domain